MESSTIIDSYWSFSAPENKIIPLNDDDVRCGNKYLKTHPKINEISDQVICFTSVLLYSIRQVQVLVRYIIQ